MSLATVETNPRQLAREIEQVRTTAQRNLGEVEQAARAAGVDCETYFEEENRSVPDAIAHITQQKNVISSSWARMDGTALLPC